MKKRVAVCLLGLILGLSTFTGCGAGGGGEGETSEESNEEKKEITIWCWDTSENNKNMYAEFTKDTGIEVNLVAVGKQGHDPETSDNSGKRG